MSIAGGLEKAPLRGREVGCATIQIFTKNASRWAAKPLGAAEADLFRKACSETGIRPVLAHNSYLINLASPDDILYGKSLEAMKDELDRAETLGLAGVVAHPGAHVGSGEEKGIERIAAAIDRIHERTEGYTTKILLETTAGQGSCLGYRFEQIAAVLEKVNDPERLGVCLDTCHIFCAGYDIRDEESYRRTMRDFDTVIGLDRLAAIHVNDSLRPFESRLDRHAHIGEGEIGIEAFACLMNDRRLEKIPGILETPKGKDMAEDLMNLATLRGLVREKKEKKTSPQKGKSCRKGGRKSQ
jgi:deoxyribonuclease IV